MFRLWGVGRLSVCFCSDRFDDEEPTEALEELEEVFRFAVLRSTCFVGPDTDLVGRESFAAAAARRLSCINLEGARLLVGSYARPDADKLVDLI